MRTAGRDGRRSNSIATKTQPSIGLRVLPEGVSVDQMLDSWRIAEDAGFDTLWTFDHLASIGPQGTNSPVFDSWTLLGAMAVTTSRIRFGCMVTSNTYRHPAVLAKMAVTVDHLSAGRLEFGIGTGWARNEHHMFGISGLEGRVGRLDEALTLVRKLWEEPVVDLSGRYYCVQEGAAWPKPVQRPHPPIWIGGAGEQTLRVVARHADVWNIGAGSNPDVGAAVDRLLVACAAVGRDPRTIRRSVIYSWNDGRPDSLLERAYAFAQLGFREQVIQLNVGSVGTAERAAELLPEVRRVVAAV
jgi:F420-dependent oxidoreductase-like protein